MIDENETKLRGAYPDFKTNLNKLHIHPPGSSRGSSCKKKAEAQVRVATRGALWTISAEAKSLKTYARKPGFAF